MDEDMKCLLEQKKELLNECVCYIYGLEQRNGLIKDENR